jgi:hypothetical protein
MKLRIWYLAAIGATALTAQTQTPRVILLEMELDNSVAYMMDVADPAKRAIDPNPTTPADLKAFNQACQLDDIVSVNGRPAKGLHMTCSWRMGFSPTPAPGWGIADAAIGQVWPNCNWELLSKDGKFVGRFVDGGFFPHSVLGGAGAFLGARGEHQSSAIPGRTSGRTASAAEDPSRRRSNPGAGAYRVQYYLIPLLYPGFEVTAEGPSVFHSADYSLVTEARPARAGELLVARARNLGPTTPYIAPGQPFPKWPENPLAEVNSDMEVTLNGVAAEVVNKIGSPGETGIYRLDFRVPATIAPGTATLQLTAAWMPSDEVKIAVR